MTRKQNQLPQDVSAAEVPGLGVSRPPPRRSAFTSSPATVTVSSDQERPIGLALIASPDLHGGRAYLCDSGEHCVHVFDREYRRLFSFGEQGSQLGQFDTPSDAAIVWIDATDPAACTVETAVLVIADRGNHRLQLFELDGAAICAIDGRAETPSSRGWPIRSGWPFFRLGAPPALSFPSRLEWRAPYLDVACSGATMVRLDLAAALLPDFRTWVREAPPIVLRQAFRRFASDPTRTEVPAACLLEIVERLQPVPRRAVLLPWRGRA
jgi:hypothetical protein